MGGGVNTDWIDLLTGMTAFRAARGEYLAFVWEKDKAKRLIDRWKPCLSDGRPRLFGLTIGTPTGSCPTSSDAASEGLEVNPPAPGRVEWR